MNIKKLLLITAFIPNIIHCAESTGSSAEDIPEIRPERSYAPTHSRTFVNYAPMGASNTSLSALAQQTAVAVSTQTIAQTFAAAFAFLIVDFIKGDYQKEKRKEKKNCVLESLQTLMALKGSAINEEEREQIELEIVKLRSKILAQHKA